VILPRRAPDATVHEKSNQKINGRFDGAITDKLDVGEVEYRFQRGGRELRGAAVCVTRFLSTDPAAGGAWVVQGLYFWEAPADRAAEAEAALAQLVASFRFREEWLVAEMKGNRDRARIASDAQRHIADTISDTYWKNAEASDRRNKRFTDAIAGVVDLRDDETGRTFYRHDNRYRHYYLGPNGAILGTDSEFSPGPEYRKLRQLEE
jgi:hypothetical protein